MLSTDADEAIAQRASGALLTQPLQEFVAAIGRVDSDPRLFTYCAENLADKPGIADALAKNPACPASVLVKVVSNFTASGIQALLEDLERLTSELALTAALAGCPSATLEQRELLQGMENGAPEAAELEKALLDAEPDPVKRETLLQRLSKMTVVERIRLSFRGNREERMALIRDHNKIVQRSVMQSPRLTDQDVEAFSAMTTLSSEVFRSISLSRAFMKNYTIVRNLTNNPKTPLDISLHLLPRLTPTDLKQLCVNKNVPETLRSSAVKLQRQRNLARQTQS
ncbi:MAG: hypothetical protein WBC04_14965 [Candidatus Acidiferrales bacterium]